MNYHIVHRQPNLSPHYDWSIGEDLLTRMVKAYLRGEMEFTTSGKKYRVGSVIFRIYESTPKQGASGVIVESIEKFQLLKSLDIEEYFEKHFKNVTDIFLRGMNCGDLKEDLFNVYIDAGSKKRVRTTVEREDLLKFIDCWHRGESIAWIEGSRIDLIEPRTLQIYDIEIAYRLQKKGETKKYLNGQFNIYGKMSTSVLEVFGKNVTHEFKVGAFGSLAKPSETKIGITFDWSAIHPEIVRVAKGRFVAPHFADAVEAAFKEINDLIKKEFLKMGNEELDGPKLMRTAFSPTNPKIKLTENNNESEKNIQEGYMNIFAGAMIGIRNPKAHANVVIDEKEAWEKIVLASHLMKMWDNRIK